MTHFEGVVKFLITYESNSRLILTIIIFFIVENMEIEQLNTVLVKNNIFGDRVENLYCTYDFLCESNVNVYESVFVRYV